MPAEVLTRSDMLKERALETFREEGRVGGTEVMISGNRGGVRFENMLQVMEFAKMMALSDIGVPPHLRGNPGACLRIAIQADAWGFDPFSVADKSYKVNDRIAYESQLVHAVIERRAPMDGRLRMEYRGEGPTRRCKVIGKLLGESEPFVWEGPEFQQIKVKNIPEWQNNPDKQLWYHASRDWARIYCPDVLLGVYTRDELENSELGPNNARQVSDLGSRLPAIGEGGFDQDGIATTLREARGEPETAAAPNDRVEGKTNPAPPQADGGHDPETGEVKDMVPDVPADPQDAKQYAVYARDWIMKAEDQPLAEKRWETEREMRARLRVSVTERKKLEKFLNERFS